MPKNTHKWNFVAPKFWDKEEREKQHFYASSIATWKVDTDPHSLINYMKREHFNFTLWLVPLDINAGYEIREFAPQVEGARCLGTYKYE